MEVELPDGTIAEFPDGTPPETIKQALRKRFGGPDFSTANPALPPESNPGLAPALHAKAVEAGKGMPGGSYSGGVLPFTRDAEGNVAFDINAGIPGAIKRALTLPGEVYKGEVDPMSPEGMDRAIEMGTVVSPVNPAIRAGDRAIPGMASARRPVKVEPPSAERLKAVGSAGFDAAREMGVDYSAPAVAKMATGIRAELEKDGILAELAPKTFQILAKLENPPEGGVAPLVGLEAARRAFGNAAKDFSNPTEQLAAKRIMERLDEFVTARDPSTVVAGPATAAANVIEEARANYAAGKRSDRITGATEKAEGRAKATGSGANIDNAIRQRIETLLQNPKQAAGFTSEERRLLKLVSNGSATRNAVRRLGNMLGGGGGLGAVVAGGAGGIAGGAMGGPAGVLLGVGAPLVGMTARAVANAGTRRAARRVDLATRRRSPLYRQMQEEAGTIVPNPELRSALSRMLLEQVMPADEAAR